jgi:hypothetical protein
VINPPDSNTDAAGTGERAGAAGDEVHDGADILPDRVIGPRGAEVDQAEAVRSISDEDLQNDEGAAGDEQQPLGKPVPAPPLRPKR